MNYQVFAAEIAPNLDELALLSVYVEVLLDDITYILYADVKNIADKKEVHYIIKYDLLKCYRVSAGERQSKKYVTVNLVDEKIDLVRLKECVRDEKFVLYEEYAPATRQSAGGDDRYLALIEDNDAKHWFKVIYSELSISNYKFEFDNILPDKYSKSSNIIDKTISGVTEISDKYEELTKKKSSSGGHRGGSNKPTKSEPRLERHKSGESSRIVFNFKVSLIHDAFTKSLIKYFGTLSYTKLSECVELKVLIYEKATASYVYEKRIALDKYSKSSDLIRHEVVSLYDTSLDNGKINIAQITTKRDDIKLVSSNSVSAIISAEFRIPLQPFGDQQSAESSGWTMKLVANRMLQEYDLTTVVESKKLFVSGDLAAWFATATVFYIEFETPRFTKSFGADLSYIINYIDVKTFYKQVLAQLCVLFGRPKEYGITIKRLTPQPVGLDRIHFNDVYPTTGMLITPKADGNHMIYYAYGNNAYILEESVLVIQLPTFQDHVDLFEGEIIHSKHIHGGGGDGGDSGDSGNSALILLFDVMILNGESMFERTTKERIARLGDATKKLTGIIASSRAVISGGSDGRRRVVTDEDAAPMIQLRAETKPFVEVDGDNPRASYEQIYLTEYPLYNIDGIMIISANTKYNDTISYKWKDNITLDFLVRECPVEMLGRFPNIKQNGKTLYHLYVGVNRAMSSTLRLKRAPMYSTLFPSLDMDTVSYFPTLFATPDMPLAYLYYGQPGLDGNIVEFSRKRYVAAATTKSMSGGRVNVSGGGSGGGSGDDDKIEVVDIGADIEDAPADRVDALIKSVAANSIETIESLKQVINADGMYWEIARVRTDRVDDYLSGAYFGNFYSIALANWDAVHNPLVFEDLYAYDEKRKNVYFKATKSTRYVTLTNYHSMLKSMILTKYVQGATWVMDVGIGRGPDLFRYAELDVKNLTGVDTDLTALNTLVSRYLTPMRPKQHSRGSNTRVKLPHLTLIHSSVVDYNTMSTKLNIVKQDFYLKDLKTLDACVFNFSIHYCVDAFGEFIKFATNCLHKQIGYVIFTSMNGRVVFDKLVAMGIKRGESYEIRDKDAETGEMYVKYRITRQFADNTFKSSGQSISVLLPFSTGESYLENLVNFDYIDSCVKKLGLEPVASSVFNWAEFSEELGVKKTGNVEKNFDSLTAADLEWVSMHSFRVYAKIK